MRLNLLLLILFLSCNSENKEVKNIIPKDSFTTILKEIHLAEAAFELSKSKGVESAKKVLNKHYSEIYLSHNIDQDKFEKTLSYYSNYPEELEEIYSKILKDLAQEKTTLTP